MLVANILVASIHALDLRYPELTPQKREQMAAARRLLEKEDKAKRA
jgi:hypothetical protein